jgi:peroxiredoxin
MTRLTRRLVLAACAVALAGPAAAAPAIGRPAPDFRAVDADGRTRSLSEFKGRTVVLEWHNGGCPYVQKHYGAGAMQSLQRQATADGAVWLTLVSSAPGTQGHLSGAEARGWKAANKAASTALLLDPGGDVGKAYDARTTPHMYVVDRSGTLVYMGGIDDRPVADPSSLKGAKNYVSAALVDLKAGRAVATPVSKPYGCSVKYKG